MCTRVGINPLCYHSFFLTESNNGVDCKDNESTVVSELDVFPAFYSNQLFLQQTCSFLEHYLLPFQSNMTVHTDGEGGGFVTDSTIGDTTSVVSVQSSVSTRSSRSGLTRQGNPPAKVV